MLSHTLSFRRYMTACFISGVLPDFPYHHLCQIIAHLLYWQLKYCCLREMFRRYDRYWHILIYSIGMIKIQVEGPLQSWRSSLTSQQDYVYYYVYYYYYIQLCVSLLIIICLICSQKLVIIDSSSFRRAVISRV